MKRIKKELTLAIIIPVYNDECYLVECLESIARQSVKPNEVIVVDNNSTDASSAVAKKYKFVRLIREPRQGIVFARNSGFDASEADIIARIDADTVLPDDWVELIAWFYADPDRANHAWTGGALFRNTRLPRVYGWVASQIFYRFNRLLLGHYILWGSNMAITRKQWKEVKAETCNDTDIHEDLDLAVHMHRLGYEITYNASVEASVVMRRLYKPSELKPNLMLWPNTLRKHGVRTWVFGWLGAKILFAFRWLAWAVSEDKKLKPE